MWFCHFYEITQSHKVTQKCAENNIKLRNSPTICKKPNVIFPRRWVNWNGNSEVKLTCQKWELGHHHHYHTIGLFWRQWPRIALWSQCQWFVCLLVRAPLILWLDESGRAWSQYVCLAANNGPNDLLSSFRMWLAILNLKSIGQLLNHATLSHFGVPIKAT